jgi:hypothetical protein
MITETEAGTEALAGVPSRELLGYANVKKTRTGKIRAICEFCGTQSKPVTPDVDGDIPLFRLARGWWCAPYPADFEHSDGSKGDRYTCKKCSDRINNGERLKIRSYQPNSPVERSQDPL